MLLDKKDSIAVVSINRPDKLNALNEETLEELDSTFSSLEKDNDVKAIILTGIGKAFCAGADINKMKDLNPEEAEALSKLGQSVLIKIENLSKPTIAAINGFALGGGNGLAISCDIRIASKNAKFGQPEITLGIIPGFGETRMLLHLVGLAKTKELILTGSIIDADEALKIGLVNKVVNAEELMNEAETIAKKIAKNSSLALKKAKSVIQKGSELQKLLLEERKEFAKCFGTADQKEGMSAFLEKREPKFKGK